MLKVIFSDLSGQKRALVKGKGWTPVEELQGMDKVKCSKNKFVFGGDLPKKYIWREWFLIPMIRDSQY